MTNPAFRIGHGYDLHRFGSKRPLILGGVDIPHDRGLEAHSDGDCVTHALADSIFGALGLPDIGSWFPDHDPKIKGIDSLQILAKAVQECHSAGYQVNNVDVTIVAELPKIGPYATSMKKALAKTLKIEPSCIGIKATTNEGIGAIGQGEGIAVFAICLLTTIAS